MVSSIVIYQSQFNISDLFAHIVCSIWPIDGTLSAPHTLDQSGPGSNSNEGIFHIPQISKAGVSSSDGLMSYSGHYKFPMYILSLNEGFRIKRMFFFIGKRKHRFRVSNKKQWPAKDIFLQDITNETKFKFLNFIGKRKHRFRVSNKKQWPAKRHFPTRHN